MKKSSHRKIIFITRESSKQAGARIRSYGFSQKLKERGYDCVVLSFADDFGAFSGIDEFRNGLFKKIYFNILCFLKLVIHRNSYFFMQRVNYHSFGVILAWFMSGSRLIVDIDDWEMRDNIDKSNAFKLLRFLAKRAYCCMASSKYLYDFLSSFSKKVFYIPSSCDENLFIPSIKRINEGVVFSWIGTFYRKDDLENIRFIIDCFKEINGLNLGKISLEIVGEGVYKTDVEDYIKLSGSSNIKHIGFIEHNCIGKYLEGIDVGLLPLIQDTKFNKSKSPAKLFEYMASAKPTISSKIGEVENIVENTKEGFVVSGKDEFRDRMVELVKNEKLRESMGLNARRKIESKYSRDSITQKLEMLFSV